MKNKYLENLNKIEFLVTYACTGRCKHCSEGHHKTSGESINPEAAEYAVKKICDEYDVKTVMAFGGEPLLYPEAVYAVMNAAKSADIPRRQIITNGYFSKNREKICGMAQKLSECGVNDLLLSVDSFHQQTIPLDTVKIFASEVKRCGIPIRLQPAWLVSREDNNPYNLKTKQILESFCDLDIPVGDGNVVFPEGCALEYLSEYFTENQPINPYTEDPCNLKCISFEPNGNVLDGNIYRQDIMEIIKNYAP